MDVLQRSVGSAGYKHVLPNHVGRKSRQGIATDETREGREMHVDKTCRVALAGEYVQARTFN